MRERRRKFTPEFKDEAVKMVIESSRPVAEVAREIQVNEGTLGNWVHKYRLDHVGEEPPLPGRRRGSHPPSPTDPDVSLSAYPARAVQLSGRVPQRPVREQVW
jgi:transposase-like protein